MCLNNYAAVFPLSTKNRRGVSNAKSKKRKITHLQSEVSKKCFCRDSGLRPDNAAITSSCTMTVPNAYTPFWMSKDMSYIRRFTDFALSWFAMNRKHVDIGLQLPYTCIDPARGSALALDKPRMSGSCPAGQFMSFSSDCVPITTDSLQMVPIIGSTRARTAAQLIEWRAIEPIFLALLCLIKLLWCSTTMHYWLHFQQTKDRKLVDSSFAIGSRQSSSFRSWETVQFHGISKSYGRVIGIRRWDSCYIRHPSQKAVTRVTTLWHLVWVDSQNLS